MKKRTDFVDFIDKIQRQDRYIKELEEENKKLKSDLAYERTMLDNVRAEYKSLQNVKEKLNIKVASLEWEIKWLNYTIDKLKEENQTLELWLDNKEKLKEKLDKLQDEYDELYIEKCNASNQWKCCEAENKGLKEDVDFFRQCYLDLKKFCEEEWFMLSDEEVTKMFNLDEIK